MSNILIILCLFVVGVAAFFFGIIYVVCQALASTRKSVLRVLMPRGMKRRSAEAVPAATPMGERTPRVCPSRRCRHVEHRPASYCSQCGEKLIDVD